MFSFGCRGKEPLADIYENTWNSLKVVLPSMATCFPFWWSSLQTNGEEGSCGTVGRFGDVGCDGLWWPCFFATCNLHGNCTPTKKTSLFQQNFPWNFAGFSLLFGGFWDDEHPFFRYLCWLHGLYVRLLGWIAHEIWENWRPCWYHWQDQWRLIHIRIPPKYPQIMINCT